jgi:hypothetical protein
MEQLNKFKAELDSAERTAKNTGQWKGEFEGSKVWIGDPSGSRTRQWEAQVMKDGKAVELRSRSFSSLKTQILRAVENQK